MSATTGAGYKPMNQSMTNSQLPVMQQPIMQQPLIVSHLFIVFFNRWWIYCVCVCMVSSSWHPPSWVIPNVIFKICFKAMRPMGPNPAAMQMGPTLTPTPAGTINQQSLLFHWFAEHSRYVSLKSRCPDYMYICVGCKYQHLFCFQLPSMRTINATCDVPCVFPPRWFCRVI